MKVLMLSHYFASHKGGIKAVADVLTHAFADAGHEVAWMAGDAIQGPQADGRVRCVPFGIGGSIFAVSHWAGESFGALDPDRMLRIVMPAVFAVALGVQIVCSSFFL